MLTRRRDVWVYHEDSDLVITSASLERPFLKRGSSAWKRAIRDGVAFAVGLTRPGPLVVRVVLNDPLSAEEDAAWVDRWETALKLPAGGLLLAGDAETMFSRDYPEFESRLSDVPAGDYLAEVFTLLPGANAIRTVAKASREKLAAYFRRTRPGEPVPDWIQKGEVAADYVEFVVRLSPLAAPPLRLRLTSVGTPPVPLQPRLPEVCPLGVPVADVKCQRAVRGPIKLTNRVAVGEMLAQFALTPVAGGPVAVPIADFARLYRIAAFCYRGAFPELRVSGHAFAPEWPNATAGVRAETIEGGWRVVFNAMNWEHVRALPRVAPMLAEAPDGTVLELMTADPDTKKDDGRPGWQRFCGPIRAGQWHITEAYPPADRATLTDALALVAEFVGGPTLAIRHEKESQALCHLARRDSMLRDALKEKKLTIDAQTASLPVDEVFLRELLTAKLFRVRFGSVWPVYTDDSADQAWNKLMDELEAFRLFRTPPEGALLLEGVRGKFFHTQGKPEDADDTAAWDRDLAALGFVPLGRMTAERVRELTILGYAHPDEPTYAVVCLGGLAPRSALDFYTTFADGSSQTTTTNGFADGDAPKWGIFKKAFPRLSPAELLAKHHTRRTKLAAKHGEPRPATATLLALAEAIDEYFVRYDA